MKYLDNQVERLLAALMEKCINVLAELFTQKEHTFLLGRCPTYPIAHEGALNLKEISLF